MRARSGQRGAPARNPPCWKSTLQVCAGRTAGEVAPPPAGRLPAAHGRSRARAGPSITTKSPRQSPLRSGLRGPACGHSEHAPAAASWSDLALAGGCCSAAAVLARTSWLSVCGQQRALARASGLWTIGPRSRSLQISISLDHVRDE